MSLLCGPALELLGDGRRAALGAAACTWAVEHADILVYVALLRAALPITWARRGCEPNRGKAHGCRVAWKNSGFVTVKSKRRIISSIDAM